MLTTLEFENFGDIEKFSMAEGSEFKCINVLHGMPEDIDELRRYFLEELPFAWLSFHENTLEHKVHHTRRVQRFAEVLYYTKKETPNVFFHTQSYGMLRAIVEALKDDKEAQDNFAYVRLCRKRGEDGHIMANCWTYEQLKNALEHNTEVR